MRLIWIGVMLGGV